MNIVQNGSLSSTFNGDYVVVFTTDDAGVYEFLFDLSAFAMGDSISVGIDVRYLSGGAFVQTHYIVYAHIQADPGKVSVPIVAPWGMQIRVLADSELVLKQVPWCVIRT